MSYGKCILLIKRSNNMPRLTWSSRPLEASYSENNSCLIEPYLAYSVSLNIRSRNDNVITTVLKIQNLGEHERVHELYCV